MFFSLVLSLVIASFVYAGAPYAKIDNPITVQTKVPCKSIEKQFNLIPTATAYSPKYDTVGYLTEHTKFTPVEINSTFQDDTLPKGYINHDTIAKMECKKGYYPDAQSFISQNYYYAKCNNGYFFTCYLDNNHIDANLTKFYQRYSGTPENLQCLKSTKTALVPCRPLCDVTKLSSDSKYTIDPSIKIYTGEDFIGFDEQFQTITIKYYYTYPQNTIKVKCANGTFLSHSTSTQKYTEFNISCNANGYVSSPEQNIETGSSAICVDAYACNIPPDDTIKKYGIYKNGQFRRTNKIAHGDFIYVYCGQGNLDERSASCLNGKIIPSSETVCIDI